MSTVLGAKAPGCQGASPALKLVTERPLPSPLASPCFRFTLPCAAGAGYMLCIALRPNKTDSWATLLEILIQ